MNPPNPAFVAATTDAELVHQTGFSRQELHRKRRALVQGTDWDLIPGRTPSERVIGWSETAAAAVLAEARGPAPDPTPEKRPGEPPAVAQPPLPEPPAEKGAPAEPAVAVVAVTPVAEKPPRPALEAAQQALPAASPKKGGEEVLTVARGPFPNPQLLACCRAGGSKNDPATWVLVRVRTSANFLEGMQLRAEPGLEGGMWKFLGPPPEALGYPNCRLPRWRGTW